MMRIRGIAARPVAGIAGYAGLANLLMVSTALMAPAQAQEAASSPASTLLPDIVVTAERRATSLQDTPISIVAVTEEAVAQKGIRDLGDLATFTPNLNINGSRGYGNNTPTFAIRGISGGGGITSERGVGLYIDNIYVPRTNGAVLRVLDIDRIEVLRGPQGTLFGRNSTGGAIRIFTKQPEQEFGGYVRATAGNLDRADIVGTINVPLGETFAVRAQGAYLHQGGYVKRGGQDLGEQTDYIGRVQARWTPSDSFTANLGVLYSDSKATGSPNVFRSFDMTPGIEGVVQGNFADWLNDAFKRAGEAPLAALNDPRIVRGDYQAPEICLIDDFDPDWDPACNQFNKNKYTQVDLTLEYDVSDNVKLTSTSGYGNLDHTGNSDWIGVGFETRPDDVKSKVLYQEIQLNTSLFDGGVDLVTGLNYFHETSKGGFYVINRRGTSVFPSAAQQASPGFNMAAFANGDDDAGLFRLTDTYTVQKSNSYGIFGSATWHITDRLNFTGGLRFAYDRKSYAQTEQASADFTPAPGTTSTFVHTKDSWTQVDYRATLDYHFSDDIMAYATISKAYKAGQFSYNIIDRVPGPDQSGDFIKAIAPEKVVNYEAGTRLTLFDRRLRLNPTAFFMQYTNRQGARQVSCVAQGPVTCPTGFVINVVNSGDVDIYGFEIDGQLALTDNLTLDASGGVTQYKIKDPVANSGPYLFPAVSNPSYNVGLNYALEAADVGRFNFNVNYAYTGPQQTHPTQGTDSSYKLPGYGLVNARIQFVPESERVSVSFFANNLLDNAYATYASRFGGGYWDSPAPSPLSTPLRSAISDVMGRPREVGVTLQYNF